MGMRRRRTWSTRGLFFLAPWFALWILWGGLASGARDRKADPLDDIRLQLEGGNFRAGRE